MAKVFLAISILLLIGAAGLGFVAKGKAEQKVAELRMMTQKYNDTDKKLTDTTGKLKTSTEDLAASNKTVEEQKSQIGDLDKKVADAKSEAEKATTAVAEKETLLASQTKEFEDYKMKHPENAVAGVPDAGAEAVRAQLEESKKAVAEANVMKEGFQQRQKVAEENLAAANKRIKELETPGQTAGLAARVMAVNAGWNFVVIDVGDKQGVTVNSPLLVMRGGQRVATLKVTSVEPRTSIADVVPGTMVRGQLVQPGDRVVFAGTRGVGVPPAPGPGASAEVAPQPAAGLPQ